MPLVLYPFNESALLISDEVNSADSLNYLLSIMERNETFVVQLESHTDSRGNASYNKELSQERAQTCGLPNQPWRRTRSPGCSGTRQGAFAHLRCGHCQDAHRR